MKADLGASKTYIKDENSHFLTDIATLLHGPEAILSDKSRIQATKTANYHIYLLANMMHSFFQNCKANRFFQLDNYVMKAT